MKRSLLILLFILILHGASRFATAQTIDGFEYKGNTDIGQHMIRSEYQFNGYTNYWHDIYREWIQYGNLYKTAIPNLAYTIAQSKVDMAEDLGIPGLLLQEGFFNGLSTSSYTVLDRPTVRQLEETLAKSDVLLLVDPNSETGKKVIKDFSFSPGITKDKLKSHQYDAIGFMEVNAYVLENGKRKLFVISSASRSVTCTPGHYLDVIGQGMNEGNDWFVFDGYMDFLFKKELEDWVDKAQLPVVTDVGTPPIYGCENYDGLQVQGNYTREKWIDYAHERGGYAFRLVYDTLATNLPYDGYIAYDARETGYNGNKEQIDNENIPFICPILPLHDDAIPSMVLFTPKGEPLTRKSMWKQPKGMKTVSGPAITKAEFWDQLRGVPEVDAAVRYEFYPGVPYFISYTSMRINETVQCLALRNAEMVFKRELITHAAWYDIIRDSVFVYDVQDIPDLTDLKMEADVPWIIFFNKEKGLAFAGIQLGYDNSGIESAPRLLNPFFYITTGPWVYWARRLSHPFVSANMQQVVPALKGNIFSEKWAFLVYSIDDPTRPYAPVLDWKKRLTQPLRMQIVEEVDQRVSKSLQEVFMDEGKSGWEGRDTKKK